MPYPNRADLPEPVKHVLPAGGEEIYQKAFNAAYEEYKDPAKRTKGGSREDVARRVAWSAVKRVYKKNEATGKWEAKKSRTSKS
jgi:cation transport regulator